MSSTTEVIDAQRALELLRQAVDQPGYGPDHVYEKTPDGVYGTSCFYFDPEGNPSCLIGHALALAGLATPALVDHLKAPNWQPDAGELDELNAVMTSEARRVWSYAQRLQDDGMPWGECVRLAEAGEL